MGQWGLWNNGSDGTMWVIGQWGGGDGAMGLCGNEVSGQWGDEGIGTMGVMRQWGYAAME